MRRKTFLHADITYTYTMIFSSIEILFMPFFPSSVEREIAKSNNVLCRNLKNGFDEKQNVGDKYHGASLSSSSD